MVQNQKNRKEVFMSKVIAGITISLDGFVDDGKGNVSQDRADFTEWRHTAIGQEMIRRTGAVVMGKRAYEMAEDPDGYADGYEFQVPLFVVTHKVPKKLPKHNEKLTFTFVTNGIESAIAKAKAAAGDRDVTVVGGVNVLQQCLEAGLADELHLDIMPVLQFQGLRLFENSGERPIRLERIKVMETGAMTHLRYRVIK
jgi:dihydrofolate reductase